MTLPDIRRIVTGHGRDGKAVVVQNGPLPHVIRPPSQKGLAFHEVWNTNTMPTTLGFETDEPTDTYRDTAPPPNGTIIRFVDIPPEGRDGPELDKAQAQALFDAVGLGDNTKHMTTGRHPLMHRTQSVDYGVVISGQIVLVLDEEEVVLNPGDVVVQRGTIHAWANRSDALCRMLFVLTDASFDPELAAAQATQDQRTKSD